MAKTSPPNCPCLTLAKLRFGLQHYHNVEIIASYPCMSVSVLGCDTWLASSYQCYILVLAISPHFNHNLFSINFGQENITMDAANTKDKKIVYTATALDTVTQFDADAAATAIAAL